MVTETQLGRLKKLREFWRSVSKEQVDLSNWTSPCGTKHCAAGWAAQVPEFIKEGFCMYITEWGVQYPIYGELTTIEAIQYFFGTFYHVFNTRNKIELGSDWDVVRDRLDNFIAKCERKNKVA
jgi:hypothetical protein